LKIFSNGIELISIASLAAGYMMFFMATEKKKILIVKLSSLGDILHALPAVHCLKKSLDAEISWIVHPAFADLVRCFSDVDRVLTFPRRASPAEFLRQIKMLRAERYDLVLDLQGILKSALVGRLARGGKRIGPSFHREGSFLFYSAVAGARNKNRHAVDENLDIVRFLGLPVLSPEFPVTVPLQLLSEPSPRVALLPFARWPSKTWPLMSFARLGRELQENREASIFILGAAADQAQGLALEKELGGRVVNLAGKTALPQLAALLREMDLVVSNDSGAMHLAAAFGAPVLAMYGPTSPVRTGPYGPRNRVLKGKLRCQPCFAKRCRFDDNSCMRTITPEAAIHAALEMLAAPKS
jgi:heptosyltransferase I